MALRLFIRAARTGSFFRAGRELGLSQPTASRIIAAMERELRVGLFTRSTRAISLTDAGSDYLARVEPILETLNAFAIWGKADIRKCGGDVRLWPETDIDANRVNADSEIRAAIDCDGFAGDPAGLVRNKKRDDRSYIVGPPDPL
jgi:DNA-binding MarR family transcriptional regulator